MGGAPITMSTLIQIGVIIMGFWGFYKVVKEIITVITDRHDREQKWDEMVKNIQAERDKIYERYDSKLAEMDKRITDNYNEINKKIDDTHTDTEAKLQEVRAELFILTDCMAAVLDGLHQQGCNGRVTQASEKLDEYLNERAHK